MATKPKKKITKAKSFTPKKAKAKAKVKVRAKPRSKKKPEKKEVPEEVNTGGRPEHEPTELIKAKVKLFISRGMSQDDTAKAVGIANKTLLKYYRHEIDTALIGTNAQVAGHLLKNCVKGNFQAQKFWLQVHAGWKITDGLEVTGKDGGPVEINDARDRLIKLITAKTQSERDQGDDNRPS